MCVCDQVYLYDYLDFKKLEVLLLPFWRMEGVSSRTLGPLGPPITETLLAFSLAMLYKN